MSTSAARITDAALGPLLHGAAHGVARRVEAALAGSGLTLDQWRVLAFLADGRGHPMSGIAGAARVPPPTLTKIVDRLVDAALVYRRVDEADRRRVLVLLSERGRDRYAELAPRVLEVEQGLAAVLGGADAARLARLLARLADGLD